MTVAKAFNLQQAVFSALTAALPGTPVFAFQPESPPARFCRIDGFTMAANEDFKNREQGDHSFTVHLIDGPTLSLAWVREKAGAAHAALKPLALDAASTPFRIAAMSAALEERKDGGRDAHAFLRYTTTIGD